MQTLVPKYYFDFKCIADKCDHNCCIGWQIDIDSDTYEKYRAVDGEMGERFKRDIEVRDGEACFKLGDDERCPFLNEKNLCDIITELSESSLCDICKDHPRFRNYFHDHIEMGVGISCEEAARLVLDSDIRDAVTLLPLDCDDEDINPSLIWDEVFELLPDHNLSLPEKMDKVLDLCGGKLPDKTVAEWVDIYGELELLDNTWTAELELLKDEVSGEYDALPVEYANPVLIHCDLSVPLTRLFTYFLYRNLPDGIDNVTIGARATFAVLSVHMIASMFRAHLDTSGELSEKQIVDIARMYSSEIEYSDENLETLIDMCK